MLIQFVLTCLKIMLIKIVVKHVVSNSIIFFAAFIQSDRPKKHPNLRISYVRGLDPVIKLYDAEDNLADELKIYKWDTDAVDEFLETHLLPD